jgi:hypothetical protein
METAIDAINKLIEGVNIAQQRGAYSLPESAEIWKAIQYINEIQSQAKNQAQQPEPSAQQQVSEPNPETGSEDSSGELRK